MKYPLLIVLCGLSLNCLALEDTPENRAKEADRYLSATPPAELFADMTANMAKNMPEGQREQFTTMMTKNLDIAALSEAMKQSMIKVFTADELQALANFYSSKEGKSAMKKFGVYMADVMPVMQSEIQKAFQKSQEASKPAAATPAPDAKEKTE
ncbi:MAG: DUF2059 domain-containing protein [Chthoniobacterales bacterium]